MNRAELPLKVRLLQPLLLRIRPAFLAAYLKRLAKIERIVVETSTGASWVDPISDFGRLVMEGAYEPNMIETLKRFLRPGSVFVDVGANEGYFCGGRPNRWRQRTRSSHRAATTAQSRARREFAVE